MNASILKIAAVSCGLGLFGACSIPDARYCTVDGYGFLAHASQACTAEAAARHRVATAPLAEAERARAVSRSQSRLSWTAPPHAVVFDRELREPGQRGYVGPELHARHP